jgi:hypothetical protein
MDADEKEIVQFLKSWPDQFVSTKEICRRAGGKWRYRDDEKWAIPIIQRMLEKAIIESDTTGHVRLVPEQHKKGKKKWWASPQMKKILEQSGRDFDGVVDVEKDLDPGDK